MSLSNDTTKDGATNAPEGRTLREGDSPLAVMHRRNIDKVGKRTLREVAKSTRFSEEEIAGFWERAKYGETSVLKLKEAVSESAMPQLLRYGVQNFLFDAYAAVPTIYPDLVRTIASSGAEELYAPLYGPELPQQVAPGQEFGDSRLLGLDVHVPNKKMGRILSIERELLDDDRTGQIITRAEQMGDRMRYAEEQDVINVLTAVNGPLGTAQYTTAIGNAPSSNTVLSQANLQAADIALQEMVDPLGNKMMVQPDTLLVSPADKFNAAILLNSALQPSVPQNSGSNNQFTSGATGWTMSTNPLQGLYSLKISRFMPTTGLSGTAGQGAAFLLESKKSLVFQDRQPLEVLQESVDSGGSFDREIYRYRVRRRYATALIEPRYVYRIN